MTQNPSGNERVRRRSLLQFGAGCLGATAITATTLSLPGRAGLDVHAQEETPANPLEALATRGPHPGYDRQ